MQLAAMDYQLAELQLTRPPSDHFSRVTESQQLECEIEPSLMGTMLFDMFSSQLGTFPSSINCTSAPTFTSLPALHDRFSVSDMLRLQDCQPTNVSPLALPVARSFTYGDMLEDTIIPATVSAGQHPRSMLSGAFATPDAFQLSKFPGGTMDRLPNAGGYGAVQRSTQADFFPTSLPAPIKYCEGLGSATPPTCVQSPSSFCLDVAAAANDNSTPVPTCVIPQEQQPGPYRATLERSNSSSTPCHQLPSMVTGPNTATGIPPSSLQEDTEYLEVCHDDLSGGENSGEPARNNSQPVTTARPELSNQSPSTDTEAPSDKGDDGLSPSVSAPASGGASQSNSAADQTPAGSNTTAGAEGGSTRPKRKRTKSNKNIEDVESQRMTHIAVERNRRKQMNEHLSVLRSLMPGSYVHKGDQASIIGGAIEFVKELEHLLQCLQAQKRRKFYADTLSPKPIPRPVEPAPSLLQPAPFSGYPRGQGDLKFPSENFTEPLRETLAESKSAVADVEVKMVGSEALVKIMSQRRPGQLIKAIAALESLHLAITHTNITTIEHTVLYSFNVKIAVECKLTVQELAAAVQQTFAAIHNMEM